MARASKGVCWSAGVLGWCVPHVWRSETWMSAPGQRCATPVTLPTPLLWRGQKVWSLPAPALAPARPPQSSSAHRPASTQHWLGSVLDSIWQRQNVALQRETSLKAPESHLLHDTGCSYCTMQFSAEPLLQRTHLEQEKHRLTAAAVGIKCLVPDLVSVDLCTSGKLSCRLALTSTALCPRVLHTREAHTLTV